MSTDDNGSGRTSRRAIRITPLEPPGPNGLDGSSHPVSKVDYDHCLIQISFAMETLERVVTALGAARFSTDETTCGSSGVFEPSPETPLPLKLAICLPELGGRLFRREAENLPSQTFRIKSLRAAITRGELVGMRQNSRIYVTRRAIRDWIARCHVTSKSHTSSNGSRDTIRSPDVSLTIRPGSSRTGPSRLSQDAVSMILRELGGSSTSTT